MLDYLRYCWLMLEPGKHSTLLVCLVLFVCLILFRLWNFVILPRVRPSAVVNLPYWIPVAGNGFQFFHNFHKTFASGSRYVKDPNKLFMLYIAGRRLLIVQAPRLIDVVTNDNLNYVFDHYVEDLYKGLVELPDDARKIIWRTPADGYRSLQPNPLGKSITHVGFALLHRQLLPSARMRDLFQVGLKKMDYLSGWDDFHQDGVLSESKTTKVISLYQWVRGVIVKVQVHSFFGPYLNELDPNIPSVWDNWSINSWMLSYGFPKLLTSVATTPRDRLISLLQTYQQAPAELRSGAAPIVQELTDEMHHAGLSCEDTAKVLVIILSSINSNLYLTTFWFMAYIVDNPSLISELRQELVTELSLSNTPENGSIIDKIDGELLDRCKLLRSVFFESIRLTSTGCTVRKTTKATVLDGKIIPQDTMVFMPVRPLLLSTAGFGPDAHSMDPYRFLNRKLERSPYFRAFGSGMTLCSGRIIGRHQVMAFAAIILLRFDTTVVKMGESLLGVKGNFFPRPDEGKPSLGISTPLKGHDMIVSVSRREG